MRTFHKQKGVTAPAAQGLDVGYRKNSILGLCKTYQGIFEGDCENV